MKKWKYCDKVEFIYHGDWTDPELKCNGKTLNYWDVEDVIYSDFLYECEMNNIVVSDENFELFCKHKEDEIIEIFQ